MCVLHDFVCFACFSYLGPVCLFCSFFLCFWCIFTCLFWVVSTRASDCLERLVSEMTIMCRAGCKTLLTHSLTPSLVMSIFLQLCLAVCLCNHSLSCFCCITWKYPSVRDFVNVLSYWCQPWKYYHSINDWASILMCCFLYCTVYTLLDDVDASPLAAAGLVCSCLC